MDKSNLKKSFDPIPDDLEEIAKIIVKCAYRVHSRLGPGLLEKIYEACFCYELSKQGLSYERQVDVPIVYDGLIFNEGLRLDVIVENKVICELKAVEQENPLWTAQLISHLRLLEKRLGFLINFNVINIGHGIKRIAN